MATIKIPVVIGSKSARLISRDTHYEKHKISCLSLHSHEKMEGFVRYHLENQVHDTIFENIEDEDPEDFHINLSEGFSGQRLSRNVEMPKIPDSRLKLATGTCNSYFPLSQSCKRKRVKIEYSKPPDYDGFSYNMVDFISHRNYGLTKNAYSSITKEYGSLEMIKNNIFKEHVINIPDVNKIFCSQWLTDDQVVMGTKCNKLLIYNINSKKLDIIPCLKGSENKTISEQCGIHTLQFNPSKTLMATGGQNSNDLAIYKLPTLDPLCTGDQAHTDWIFDTCWLDDEILATASRDKSLALWRVDGSMDRYNDTLSYGHIDPLCQKKCLGADKVRAILFNENYMEVVALSLNAKIHVWDATHFRQIMSQKLELSHENVCLVKNETCSMYAVGSKSHVTLIDPRTLQSISKIDTRKSCPSIRSMSFRGNLLTLGTGNGDILFFDIQAGRYLEGSQGSLELNCFRCKVSIEEPSLQFYSPPGNRCPSAIYTHCYDWSGTRLFTAGGPLSAGYNGSYASVWC